MVSFGGVACLAPCSSPCVGLPLQPLIPGSRWGGAGWRLPKNVGFTGGILLVRISPGLLQKPDTTSCFGVGMRENTPHLPIVQMGES